MTATAQVRVLEDMRIATFFDWFGAPRTILALGAGPGTLPVRETTERLLSLDADDLDSIDLSSYGRFDAVFCVDLAEPWRLLAATARVADALFLDTPYCQGSRVAEVDGRLGGEVDGSFRLTRPALLEALTASGWAIRHQTDLSRHRSKPRLLLGCVKP